MAAKKAKKSSRSKTNARGSASNRGSTSNRRGSKTNRSRSPADDLYSGLMPMVGMGIGLGMLGAMSDGFGGE